MARAGRYVPNYDGFAAVAVSPAVRAACLAIAARAKATAEQLAQEFRVTGDYAGSFEISDDVVLDDVGRHRHKRVVVYLTNTSDHAAVVEVGHRDQRTGRFVDGHHVLARTLDSLGGNE